MSFAYENAVEKGGADRLVTVSSELDPVGSEARRIEAMKDRLLRKSVRQVACRPGAVRPVRRVAPSTGDIDESVACHG